ncbi:MAG: hypothetical protein ACF8TS_03310 [Maioricimonas sp. JB049]
MTDTGFPVPGEGLYQIVVRQHVPSSHGLANRLFAIGAAGVESWSAVLRRR